MTFVALLKAFPTLLVAFFTVFFTALVTALKHPDSSPYKLQSSLYTVLRRKHSLAFPVVFLNSGHPELQISLYLHVLQSSLIKTVENRFFLFSTISSKVFSFMLVMSSFTSVFVNFRQPLTIVLVLTTSVSQSFPLFNVVFLPTSE